MHETNPVEIERPLVDRAAAAECIVSSSWSPPAAVQQTSLLLTVNRMVSSCVLSELNDKISPSVAPRRLSRTRTASLRGVIVANNCILCARRQPLPVRFVPSAQRARVDVSENLLHFGHANENNLI